MFVWTTLGSYNLIRERTINGAKPLTRSHLSEKIEERERVSFFSSDVFIPQTKHKQERVKVVKVDLAVENNSSPYVHSSRRHPIDITLEACATVDNVYYFLCRSLSGRLDSFSTYTRHAGKYSQHGETSIGSSSFCRGQRGRFQPETNTSWMGTKCGVTRLGDSQKQKAQPISFPQRPFREFFAC